MGKVLYPEYDFCVDTYDTRSGQKLSSFAKASDVSVGDFVIVPNSHYALATVGERDRGGLAVFDLRTEKLVQRRTLAPTLALRLSQDGKRVVATAPSGLVFYKMH